ncbi:glycosyltransferase family 1 protein [Chelatococcus sp. SYSU_G07232]|uniref:Glycosyltransferase family 1 protein n=1 Tax=Chelatococcus albus TaxID=3047466 RepID=A0ABT7ACI5_9HYPH|nr:glycosyltransferase family 1 protein [Chelatococcus sp. SYSU_G07232]MDJ1157079.1 glycosyltransferase family 1 protein [Chelatococcus sp. SYSU_G07232]
MRRYWTINGRFLTQSITGVQRYAREILRAMDELLCEGHALARDLVVEILVPANATAGSGADWPELRAVRMRSVGRFGGHVWEQLELPSLACGGIVSLCNTGPVARRRQIVCIHDANTFICPDSYSWRFRTAYRALLPVIGRVANQVATVSAFSADQLARHGVAARDKITIVPDGHEHVLRWRPRHSAVTRAAAGPDTVVVIGSAARHKNLDLICGLADRLAVAGLRIAVVGRVAARVFRRGAPGETPGNVLWLGPLSDGELAALLGDCLCLAFPSLTEGFGLPPLEAMALGCPVVTSDRASLPEVCGEAALYASPTAPEEWSEALFALRARPSLRADLVRKGRDQATRFSWRASAELYLRLMAQADGFTTSARQLVEA